MTSFPSGTNVFFTNPKSSGFNNAMIGILHSAEDIQKFIDDKMDQSDETVTSQSEPNKPKKNNNEAGKAEQKDASGPSTDREGSEFDQGELNNMMAKSPNKTLN